MGFRQTVNLGNSIIGVSILAMPYCFRKCGILLSVCLIVLSGLLNRAGCHFLLKSATMSRKRNFELLAYAVFGSTGKLVVEIGILGFLVGTCVAFFVVIGDLGPSLVSEVLGIPNGPLLRASCMTFLGMFVALPLGLLRRVESLTSFSALSLGLYSFLILKLFSEASANLMTASEKQLVDKINWWDSSAILSSLPIFAMALSGQTQLFEIFDPSAFAFSEDSNGIKKLNEVVKGAVNICSIVYVLVGILGYVAFYDQPFRGNILIFLPSSFTSTMTKIGFIFTVVISLPLCLFPCRTSLHSLLFRKGTGSLLNEYSAPPSMYMSDRHFRLLTIFLIVITVGISILIPKIEIVLGIIGSTIGAVICFILPAMIFIQLTHKNTTERLMAHVVSYVGIFILVACSYSTLRDAHILSDGQVIMKSLRTTRPLPVYLPKGPTIEVGKSDLIVKSLEKDLFEKVISKKPETYLGNQRQGALQFDSNKIKKQEELLHRLEKQQQEHKKLIEQQKKFLQEIKLHEETHHNVEAKEDSPEKKPVVGLPVNVSLQPNVKSALQPVILPEIKATPSKAPLKPAQNKPPIQQQNQPPPQDNRRPKEELPPKLAGLSPLPLALSGNVPELSKNAEKGNKSQMKGKAKVDTLQPKVKAKAAEVKEEALKKREIVKPKSLSQVTKNVSKSKFKESGEDMAPKRDILAVVHNSSQK